MRQLYKHWADNVLLLMYEDENVIKIDGDIDENIS